MSLKPLRLTPQHVFRTIGDKQSGGHHDEHGRHEPGPGDGSDDTSHRMVIDTPAALIQLEAAKLETEKRWMRYRVQLVLMEEELRALNDDLFHVYLQVEGQRQQGSDQSANPKGKANYELLADSTSPQGSARLPSFMMDYGPVPELGPPNPNDGPEERRCSVGRPVGKVLKKGTTEYGQGVCDKHRKMELFEENMRINGGVRERDHAWKCV